MNDTVTIPADGEFTVVGRYKGADLVGRSYTPPFAYYAGHENAFRVVAADDRIVTCAGVSAGIDLGLWLAGRIGGEGRAKAIQLSMEYDPQPPFDSGHMSKASTSTKAAATALMGKEMARPATLAAAGGLMWDAALARIRRGRRPSPSILR